MNNTALVSICIPTYNRANMVNRTIESALDQTYPHIEVIVVDDCSTDNTDEIVASFNDPRLKYVKNSRNLGQFQNCNLCLDIAKGKYIHILHSDDYIEPDFTRICVSFLEDHPEVSLTYSSAHFTCGDEKQEITNFPSDMIFNSPDGFRQILMQTLSIITPSVMARRDVYKEIGYFSPEYPYAADYYQWLRISRKYSIAYVRSAWINYRIGNHSESHNYLFRNPTGYLDLIKIYTRTVVELGDDSDEFTDELNFAFYQFIRTILSAGLTRSEQISAISPSFFYGIALSTISLVRARSMKEKLIKIKYILMIHFIGFCMSCSVTRQLIRPFLAHPQLGY